MRRDAAMNAPEVTARDEFVQNPPSSWVEHLISSSKVYCKGRSIGSKVYGKGCSKGHCALRVRGSSSSKCIYIYIRVRGSSTAQQ